MHAPHGDITFRPSAQVEELLLAGADVNGQDTFGETALMVACMAGHAQLAQILAVEFQAALDLQNWEGWTALVWAIVRGHEGIVRFLAHRGASLHARTHLKWTPLHFAALQSNFDLAGWMLEEGADPVAVGADGSLPGDVAADSSVREMLLKAGALGCMPRTCQAVRQPTCMDSVRLQCALQLSRRVAPAPCLTCIVMVSCIPAALRVEHMIEHKPCYALPALRSLHMLPAGALCLVKKMRVHLQQRERSMRQARTTPRSWTAGA